MSYDSWDGGSHGSHQWRAVGYEKIDHTVWSKGGPTASGTGWRLPLPGKEDIRHYIVRACELCPEVWLQEFDPFKAMAA